MAWNAGWHELNDFLQELLHVICGDASRNHKGFSDRPDLNQMSSTAEVRVLVQSVPDCR